VYARFYKIIKDANQASIVAEGSANGFLDALGLRIEEVIVGRFVCFEPDPIAFNTIRGCF
jgi:hypothetical protein